MRALKTEDGLSAFARCLGLEESQILVIEGEKRKIRRALGMAASCEEDFAVPSQPEAQAGMARADKLRVDEQDLRVDGQDLRVGEQKSQGR